MVEFFVVYFALASCFCLKGNVVSLWERLCEESELLVELGSDQTSCHNPFGGGCVLNSQDCTHRLFHLGHFFLSIRIQLLSSGTFL